MTGSDRRSVAAIDLGATSGRVLTGTVADGELRVREVARFPNIPVRLPDGLHWDVLSLYSAAMTGLGQASREDDGLAGAAVDSWAVDYGLLRGPRLLGAPYHYRDDRTEPAVGTVHAAVDARALWQRNGLQHLPFTTLFQLAASQAAGELDGADRMLLIPDLIGWWATGTQVAERTNASTTGLLDVGTGEWDRDLLRRLDLPRGLLPELVDPGTALGPVAGAVRDAFGIRDGVLVTTVGSHDTASAVVGVPMAADESAYISCGTWSLLGAELERPVLTEDARAAGFTNERGVDGRTRFLRNVAGLWLLSESLRAWERAGRPHALEALLAEAAEVPEGIPTFDANDPRLLAPRDMPSSIRRILEEQGDPVPSGDAALVRSVLQSLANAYADAVRDLERVTGRPVRTVHLVGGGARNELLCRLTATAVGRPVVAGPVEATAVGNLLVQARTHGLLSGDLGALRDVGRRSFPPRVFHPRTALTRG